MQRGGRSPRGISAIEIVELKINNVLQAAWRLARNGIKAPGEFRRLKDEARQLSQQRERIRHAYQLN
ncbi:MAG: hypothetical protein HJJLKODD_02524 [Phycisphaerae bacterium]|nr:hypothetical protein [Phycisphaerae bacterium]